MSLNVTLSTWEENVEGVGDSILPNEHIEDVKGDFVEQIAYDLIY